MTSLSSLVVALSLLPGLAPAASGEEAPPAPPTVEQAETAVVEAIHDAPKNAMWAANTPEEYETIWLLAGYARHEDPRETAEERSARRALTLKGEFWKAAVSVLDTASQDAALAGTFAPGSSMPDLAQEQQRLARSIRLARLRGAARLIVADIEADDAVVAQRAFKPGSISARRLALFQQLGAIAP